MVMELIDAAEFEKQWFSLIDSLPQEGLVITEDGRPLARLLPLPRESSGPVGSMKDKIQVTGNLLSTGQIWHVEDQPG